MHVVDDERHMLLMGTPGRTMPTKRWGPSCHARLPHSPGKVRRARPCYRHSLSLADAHNFMHGSGPLIYAATVTRSRKASAMPLSSRVSRRGRHHIVLVLIPPSYYSDI